MNAVTYQVRYRGATQARGSRWLVRDTVSGVRRTVPFDYSATGPLSVDAVRRAFPDVARDAVLVWSGSGTGVADGSGFVTAVWGE